MILTRDLATVAEAIGSGFGKLGYIALVAVSE